MQDKVLYEKILGLAPPWSVSNVDLQLASETVTVTVEHPPLEQFACPDCGELSKVHDHRERNWRHLDTCGFVTIITADVPRVKCSKHGVKQVPIPWANPGSGYTAMFEALVISWLKVASISAVSDRLGITWDVAWGIMNRAVKRGLERRTVAPITQMAIDETSFQKRHEYVSVIVDKELGVVIDVLDDRKKKTLKTWLKVHKEQLTQVESVSMDMWTPFINAVKETLPNADKIICFDRFHVAGYFGKALDKVRSKEHRSFDPGKSPLTKTKYDWLRTKANGGYKDEKHFISLTKMHLKTARAWRIKETAAGLWSYRYKGVADRNWKKLLGWISRCRLDPVKKVGRMIREHLWGILNAIILKTTNAMAESFNASIQKIKARACGFRNRARLRIAVLFHLGGLSLLPAVLDNA